MKGELSLINRQRTRKIEVRRLRRTVEMFLNELPESRTFELAIALVDAKEMTLLNEKYLHHAGSTDVITFDYSLKKSALLAGEIVVCVDEALVQAKRFDTEWKSELLRYVVHGMLHLLGHDDQRAAARQRMKLEENRWVRRLTASKRIE